MGRNALIEEEYTLLVFRAGADLPFSAEDQKRLNELKKLLDKERQSCYNSK